MTWQSVMSFQGIYRIVECGTATWLHEPISRNADR